MPKLAVQCLVEVKTYYSVVFFFTPKCISREKICSLSKTVNYLGKIDEIKLKYLIAWSGIVYLGHKNHKSTKRNNYKDCKIHK